MGHWGVRSDENDDAAEALDAGFERVHGAAYDDLMDDGNTLTVDQIHRQLAGPETLAAALEALREEFRSPEPDWDESERLAFAGVVVRHAELGVPIPEPIRDQALAWLRDESIEWDEATARMLRRQKEIDLLGRAPGPESPRP